MKMSSWQAWDIASDQHLEKRFKEQVTDKQIAKELRRSVFAVSQRRAKSLMICKSLSFWIRLR
jgi:hypothetical protein